MRSKSIDSLRAVAIFLVFGSHMAVCPFRENPFFHRISSLWFKGGWAGVDLFFTLSGFLIAGLLFSEYQKWGSISFRHFFFRRGLKIYPAFYFMIFITLVEKVLRGRALSLKGLLSEIFFLQNYGSPLWYHTWSLAVEEHFYIFLPLLLIGLSSRARPEDRPFKFIPIIFLIIGIACLALRYSNPLPYQHHTHVFPTHLRMDSLFFGVLLSYFYQYHRLSFIRLTRRYKFLFLFVGCLLFIPPFVFAKETTPFITNIGLSFLYIGSGLILMVAVADEFKPSPLLDWLATIGSHSYSIYLWHIPMAVWGVTIAKRLLYPHWNWFVYLGVYIIGSLVIGILLSQMIEIPLLRIRNRLLPSRSTAL